MPTLRIELSHMKQTMLVAIHEHKDNIVAEAVRQVEAMVSEDGFKAEMARMIRQELDSVMREKVRDVVRKVLAKREAELEAVVSDRLLELMREDQVRDVMEG